MKFKTIDDFDLKGKTVLVRADLNSELKNNKPVLSDRISESAETVKDLKRVGAKVVILAHQGRDGKISLREHSKLLSKYSKVKFVDDVIGKKAVAEILKLKNGEALLLENVRGLKDEFDFSKDNALVKVLSNLCDVYLNDAFSVSHRKQISIVGFPKVLSSGIGRLMEKELNGLRKLSKVKNALYILGGSKEDNLLLMRKRKVITCGIWGQLCLIAKGKDLGAQNKFLKDKISVVKKLRKVVLGRRTPMDLVVKINGKRRELSLSDFPSKYEIFDIGSQTIELYSELIKDADAIFMKGPAGYCEDAKFCKGTRELLKAISKAKGFSVLGGGHLSTALKKFKINKNKFNHVSLSGGALVWFLAGKKLIGLEVLRK